MADLRNIIRELAKTDGETVALVCTVDAVDEKARTIDCTPLNEGAPLLGVNLQANQGANYGFWLYPEVGSFVIVGFVADGAAGVVLSTEKIKQAEVVIGDTSAVMDADGCRIKTANMSANINADNIIFNGGKLNGLVKIDDLTKRLNTIENEINKLKGIMAGWVPVAQDGGAALKTAAADWSADTLLLTKRSDYENEKIKQ
ncbi:MULTISPECIES: hypothetical protein [Muribaculaceae]|jgi:hypothetical protein|uniref:Uncharacterized protein n=2 Tax=Duncaniella freteri TaxID=2530391 RepID=A0A4Z0V2C6_9BACT|nr:MULTISPECIES: hypothetical protein [Muribaculaceae]TGG34894.1 hypothetical protein EZ315_16220 [Duncaniella freteri]TGG36187.1 hypothetical protein EZ315_09890 [Duncaniella freteri]TGG39198.1 hypothetical protein EZ315_00150 [Duncaniella freteri]TGG40933.1 hypothetical protein EZ315_09745 [Duncaniella freteri]